MSHWITCPNCGGYMAYDVDNGCDKCGFFEAQEELK